MAESLLFWRVLKTVAGLLYMFRLEPSLIWEAVTGPTENAQVVFPEFCATALLVSAAFKSEKKSNCAFLIFLTQCNTKSGFIVFFAPVLQMWYQKFSSASCQTFTLILLTAFIFIGRLLMSLRVTVKLLLVGFKLNKKTQLKTL